MGKASISNHPLKSSVATRRTKLGLLVEPFLLLAASKLLNQKKVLSRRHSFGSPIFYVCHKMLKRDRVPHPVSRLQHAGLRHAPLLNSLRSISGLHSNTIFARKSAHLAALFSAPQVISCSFKNCHSTPQRLLPHDAAFFLLWTSARKSGM
jgi:hypothetical protein